MSIKPIADTLMDYAISLLKDRIVKYAMSAIGLAATGFWGKLVAKLIMMFLEKLVFPALEDLKEEGFLLLRERELKAKLKEYLDAETDNDFDNTFDNLISGSKLR